MTARSHLSLSIVHILPAVCFILITLFILSTSQPSALVNLLEDIVAIKVSFVLGFFLLLVACFLIRSFLSISLSSIAELVLFLT